MNFLSFFFCFATLLVIASCNPTPPCEINPCAFTDCLPGYTCIGNRGTCTASCRKTCSYNPCATALCITGTQCYPNWNSCTFKCRKTPCEKPSVVCLDPCESKICKDGFHCVRNKCNGCTARCIPNTLI